MVIAEIRAKLTHVMGWFNRKLAIAWRNIFPLTANSARLGFLPLMDPTWGKMPNSWWQFLANSLSLEEEQRNVWRVLPQVLQVPMLCEENPMDTLSERRILEAQLISTFIMGNRHCTKIIQVFKPTLEFSIHAMAREMNLGVFEHLLTLCPRKGKTKEMMALMGWNLRREAEILPHLDECPTPFHQLTMNIIVWNCRGILKPNY